MSLINTLKLNSEIKEKLNRLEPLEIEIIDDSKAHIGHPGAMESGGGHFNIRIVAKVFSNKNRIDRHRLVYECLKDLIPKKIHALSLHALTPDEKNQINQPIV